MEGRGVINYETSKPSIGYTDRTTQFDDALLKRGIITFEQAMMAKGASKEEAQRLCLLRKQQRQQQPTPTVKDDSNNNKEDEDEEDDKFLKEYRNRRLVELKKENNKECYGTILPINRTDWTREVNEASMDGTWVIILLTAATGSGGNTTKSTTAKIQSLISTKVHSELCTFMETCIVPKLARKYPTVKFVSIPCQNAIPNWPMENLPTLFCYQYGTLQHQFTGLDDILTRGEENDNRCCYALNRKQMECRLREVGVIHDNDDDDDDEEEEEEERRCYFELDEQIMNTRNGQSRFGGGMSTLATRDVDYENDYDDVD